MNKKLFFSSPRFTRPRVVGLFAICYLLFAAFAFAQTGQVDLSNVPDIAAPSGGSGGAAVGGWINNLYRFALIGGVFLAVGVITWAGLKYALAAGNASTQSDARDQILQAVLGLLLLFGAYLILYTINPRIVNLELKSLDSVNVERPTAPAVGNWTTGGTIRGTGLPDAQARQQVTDAGITIKTGQGAASLEGLQQSTVNGVIGLKRDCLSCEIMITSGTDGSHSTRGIQSHANGYKVDLKLTDSLNRYIANPDNGFTRLTNRITDGAPQYRDRNGNIYAREKDHWDVLYH